MSLGVRPQAMKLHFVSNEIRGTFLKPQISLHEAVLRMQAQFDDLEGMLSERPPYHREFIGELGSLVFSPVFLGSGKLFDAILRKPIGSIGPDSFANLDRESPDCPTVTAIPTLCPNCGNGLRGGRESLVLLCAVCRSGYVPSPSGWTKTGVEVVAAKGDSLIYIPFWRIAVSAEGVKLESYADLARLANLPRVIRPEWERRPVPFWVPAFKAPPPLFLRLAKQMTLFQPGEKTDLSWAERPVQPVTISEKNASACLKVILAALLSKKKERFAKLNDIKIVPVESALVLLPFSLNGSDAVSPEMGISIQKQILSPEELMIHGQPVS
jgi:hypothetical protein